MTTNCYLLIGLPASGKTTASKELAVAKKAVVISTDKIRKHLYGLETVQGEWKEIEAVLHEQILRNVSQGQSVICLLYTSDAADDTPCVDLGGCRIIKKKK